ncbi:MAG TPA: alpha/beta fold hydrolase [Mycobacteriales bacterium]|nr:alpha/beta fold hydrolase [Mycobacteriales bacterium]
MRGEGRPLVLIMGIGGNLDMWDPFERALHGHGIRTVTYDSPGTGESADWLLPRRMGGLARLVVRLLDGLGYGQVDVLGVSLGGAVAQQLAHLAPPRVRRLVLAATTPGLGGVPGSPAVMLALASPRRYRSPAYLRRVAPDLYGGRMRREPALLDEHSVARLTRPPSTAGYLKQLYAVPWWSSLPWLHRLPQPTLVLAGDDDPIVPLVNGRILARRIPRARLHVVPGGGHLFLLEEAPEMAALVAAFLAEPAPGHLAHP